MPQLRSLALVALAACGARSTSYKHTSAAYAPPHANYAAGTMAAEPGSSQGDTHVHHGINPWTETSKDRLSTFAADVDTASYTYGRRLLKGGALPPAASVRVEEYVNYFQYAFPPAQPGSPFSVVLDAAPSPLVAGHHILRVGVATPVKSTAARKPANLVFLVDVSGSMSGADRLPLAKESLKILTNNLKESDSVSLVTYSGSTGVVLPATSVEHRGKIIAAIDRLGAGGSTAMGSGLDLAYEQAMKGLRPGGISRVIVLSDGDANVGAASHQQLLDIIGSRVKAGITLSTIGFGMGNYRGDLMEQLADKGDGNSYYIDSLESAKKLFTENLVAMLEVAAKDTKLQIEFDPAMVARYRLVGYENRNIADEDFRNDSVDAGEIGAGHQVTALYELQLTDAAKARPGALATVRIRHKAPDAQEATEATFAMRGAPAASFATAPADLRFAFAVAAFADVLRGAPAASGDAASGGRGAEDGAQGWSLLDILAVARATAGADADRQELVSLIEAAAKLKGTAATVAH